MKITWRQAWQRAHRPDANVLWWPVWLTWGGQWHWFGWHGIEATRNYPDRCQPHTHCQVFAQVFHLGKVKIVLGRWKEAPRG